MSVNLSAPNLVDLELPSQVNRLLNRWSVPSGKLVLEITENFIMADPVRAKAVLDRLGEWECCWLSTISAQVTRHCPFRGAPDPGAEIDMSFVTHMSQDDGDAAIVRSTIELGHKLGLSLVAERSRLSPLWNELWSLRCDIAQGYFLSAALPAQEFGGWIRRRVTKSALSTNDA